MHMGPLEEGERALAPFREVGEAPLDAFGPIPYAELQCALDDPPGRRNYWTVELLRDIPDEAITLVHERAMAMPGSAPQIFCVAWGGAVARVGADQSPLAERDAAFAIHPLMMWDDPADDERVMAWGRAFRKALAPYATGDNYANFAGEEGERRIRAAYAPSAYERLARIKREWDPDDVFRAQGHVPPAK
jgi:FAD/FMN-containing dehydrogenase